MAAAKVKPTRLRRVLANCIFGFVGVGCVWEKWNVVVLESEEIGVL